MSVNNLTSTSRYLVGGTTDIEGDFLGWWEMKDIPRDPTDYIYTIEKIYEKKPQLLANALYGDTRLWWVILQYNSILDPITEFVEGVVLYIPQKERVLSYLKA